MFNPAEGGVGIVRIPDPKELDGEHCINSAVLDGPIGTPGSLFSQRDFMSDIFGSIGEAFLDADHTSSLRERYGSSLATAAWELAVFHDQFGRLLDEHTEKVLNPDGPILSLRHSPAELLRTYQRELAKFLKP
jgi:hypothetical protein